MENNNKIIENRMKLIYLHLYKDTYLMFMQAHNHFNLFCITLSLLVKEKKNVLSKILSIYISKIRVLKA